MTRLLTAATAVLSAAAFLFALRIGLTTPTVFVHSDTFECWAVDPPEAGSCEELPARYNLRFCAPEWLHLMERLGMQGAPGTAHRDAFDEFIRQAHRQPAVPDLPEADRLRLEEQLRGPERARERWEALVGR